MMRIGMIARDTKPHTFPTIRLGRIIRRSKTDQTTVVM